MNKLKLYLEWCVTTLFGILMQRKFCKVWDSKLNQLLNNHEGVLSRSGWTITFNETVVWVGNRGMKDKEQLNRMMVLAYDVLHNNVGDVTSGALYYHANYVDPYWSKHYEYVITIGNHLFYK